MPDIRGLVALTDLNWFNFLRGWSSGRELDEVNFWRPRAQNEFRALNPGDPFFLRLKNPVNAVVGYGFFAHATRLPVPTAWDAFAEKNGDPTFERFVSRIANYRGEAISQTIEGELTCLILRSVTFLPEERWLGWADEQDFARNIVSFKSYDLGVPPGTLLQDLLRNSEPEEFTTSRFQLVEQDVRLRAETTAAIREGQGVFRVRVLDAYQRRCAVTGERTLPVLEAAHIQRYLGPKSNHIQNGLSLRADLHRLFDTGYVTVTPDLRFQVSKKLRDDFENGRVYYELEGRPLLVLPRRQEEQPSLEALEWHANHVFKG
jgi:putative restriction endonuclease